MTVILPVTIGAIVGWFYDRWSGKNANPEFARRKGVLAATGMIVGDSLWGVAFAGIVYGTGSDAPLALVGGDFEATATLVSLFGFSGLVWLLYSYTQKLVRQR